MDDPMIRPRLDRINGTRPLGALDPKPEPPPFSAPSSESLADAGRDRTRANLFDHPDGMICRSGCSLSICNAGGNRQDSSHEVGKANILDLTRPQQESSLSPSRSAALLLMLGAVMLATDRWFTEVDDECAIIDQAATPISHTLKVFLSGAGQHEHPPLYDIFLHFWLRLTGGNMHLLRAPSVIFYLAGAWILAEVARKMGGGRSQLWLLAIVVLWPFGFHFGRLTTWYSLSFLLVSLLTFTYFKCVGQPSAANWLWFLLASLALVYSNYFGWAFLLCLAFDYADPQWHATRAGFEPPASNCHNPVRRLFAFVGHVPQRDAGRRSTALFSKRDCGEPAVQRVQCFRK